MLLCELIDVKNLKDKCFNNYLSGEQSKRVNSLFVLIRVSLHRIVVHTDGSRWSTLQRKCNQKIIKEGEKGMSRDVQINNSLNNESCCFHLYLCGVALKEFDFLVKFNVIFANCISLVLERSDLLLLVTRLLKIKSKKLQ